MSLLTPQIAGSTDEAQKAIGIFVMERIVEYMNSGSTLYCVNFPNVQLPKINKAHWPKKP